MYFQLIMHWILLQVEIVLFLIKIILVIESNIYNKVSKLFEAEKVSAERIQVLDITFSKAFEEKINSLRELTLSIELLQNLINSQNNSLDNRLRIETLKIQRTKNKIDSFVNEISNVS